MFWEWKYIVSLKNVGVEVYTLINLWNLDKFSKLVELDWILIYVKLFGCCTNLTFDYIMIIEFGAEYIIII